MLGNSIYNSIETARNGTQIPVLKNGKTIESRYNPQNEAQRFTGDITQNDRFIIVLGIAGGTLINSILEKNKDAFILAIETCREDIEFLKQIPLVKEFSERSNVCLTCQDDFYNELIKTYIPAFYGNIKIIEQKSWCMENAEAKENILKTMNEALKIVSQDFSVQAHFGKIWNDNIIKNLILSGEIKLNKEIIGKIDNKKEAVVVAAGPSLDSKLKELISNKNKYYIIATDTAYSILSKNNITSDAVISIDGQSVSYTHFIGQKDYSSTLFIFDLSANNSAVNHLALKNANVLFSFNNHPLSTFAAKRFEGRFINLYTGSGTVTIAALDFARLCGFKNIRIIGADFSYINGKPYAKATYLDSIYSKNSSRLLSTENQFSKLMFRTPLIKVNNKQFTTEVLLSYKTGLEEYLKAYDSTYTNENSEYKICLKNQTGENKVLLTVNKVFKNSYSFNDFIKEFEQNYSPDALKNSLNDLSEYDICLLPLMSQLKMNENINNESFSSLLNIAYKTLLRYN